MSKQLKLRRGTTAQHSTFTGAEGEVTVDTTKDTLVVHDGVTAGGVPLATEAALNAKQAADAELTTLAGMSSSRATYLASTQGFGFRNRIINGDMRIDQRNAGASVSGPGPTYTVDRFSVLTASGSGNTFQRVSDAPVGFVNSLKVTVGTGAAPTSGQQNILWHPIEGYNVADFGLGAAGAATFTVSFWVKSSIAGTYSSWFHNVGSLRSYVANFTINSANTWEYKTLTVAGDTSGTWNKTNDIGLVFGISLGVNSVFQTTAGSWASGDYKAAAGSVNLIATSGATFYITGVQLEAGTVASPFERRDYGRELMMCQRYYVRQSFDAGGVSSSSDGRYYFPLSFPVTMRATPTTAWVSGGNVSTGVPQGAITGQTNTVGGSPTSVLVGVTGPSVAGNGTGAVMYNDPIFQLTAEL